MRLTEYCTRRQNKTKQKKRKKKHRSTARGRCNVGAPFNTSQRIGLLRSTGPGAAAERKCVYTLTSTTGRATRPGTSAWGSVGGGRCYGLWVTWRGGSEKVPLRWVTSALRGGSADCNDSVPSTAAAGACHVVGSRQARTGNAASKYTHAQAHATPAHTTAPSPLRRETVAPHYPSATSSCTDSIIILYGARRL